MNDNTRIRSSLNIIDGIKWAEVIFWNIYRQIWLARSSGVNKKKDDFLIWLFFEVEKKIISYYIATAILKPKQWNME